MRYNVRGKFFSDGSAQFLKMPGMFDTLHSKKKRYTGENIERGKEGNLKKTIQEIYDIAKSNEWSWFLTLTFNPDLVDSFCYDDVCAHMVKFTRILRDLGCKYIFVPELHPSSGRFHFHGLVFGDIPVVKAIDPYTGQVILDKKGRIVYNVPVYKLGFSTATKISDSDRAACYLTKYMSKELGEAVPKGKKRYWSSKSLVRPEKEYYKMSDEEYAAIFTSSRYRKTMFSEFGRFDLCEY